MIKKISLPSSLRPGGKESGKVVKYTPCSTSGRHLDDDLDEVAVISNAAPESIRYGSGQLSTANGPRVVPGIITSHLGGVSIVQRDYRAMSTSSASARPSLSQIQIPSALASTSIVSARPADGHKLKVKCASRQSLIDTVTGKFQPRRPPQSHLSSDLEIPKKTRELRRKEIKKEFERWETSTSASDRGGCNWSFVFDPSGRLCYYWSMVVSVAFLYNFWTIIYRCAFQEISEQTVSTWFTFDYLSDFVYILDIAVHFRTGYLEEGVLQTDGVKLRQHYMNCTMFYIDSVLGYVANIVTNVSAARKEFQAKLDAVKTYMRMRRVPEHIQTKVIRWFDYLWMTQKSSDEERSVGCLPDIIVLSEEGNGR
ncbi:unnamed protein product [Medioppia subpectinata]|uniref:Ion transport domain-containing protein n=1 Tax=Medioppia subpectinata TaxID=1979941 RepID=A0A7R9KFK2_9ACAR|nr:unnamed protein product [Medioppia subpectinata]CAG2101660.1 unnamed protein product [Medioppia subpectinata]